MTADCKQNLHYMVDLSSRLAQIKEYVDEGKYFTINRARQYGKTTTLRALKGYLKDEYYVISMDFQVQMSFAKFRDENAFSVAFAKAFVRIVQNLDAIIPAEMKEAADNLENATQKGREELELVELFQYLSAICQKADKPLVLMIDEVDSAANNQVFLDFLAQLRGYYIDRDSTATFHCVILAGIYDICRKEGPIIDGGIPYDLRAHQRTTSDIKNLKLKLRPEAEHQYNSPWNIAADFSIEMSFSIVQIEEMLQEYEEDHCTGMDIKAVAEEIYQYTSGYPYLVSAICKLMDEEIADGRDSKEFAEAWSKEGVARAVKILLKENVPLFDSMIKQLDIFHDLRSMIEEMLYKGRKVSFSPAEKSINLGIMFGFLKEKDGYVAVSNRIFEMYLLNLFISEESIKSEIFFYGQSSKGQFIVNSRLNMELVLEKFIMHFTEIYGDNDQKFIEEYGRKFFLLYLKPIINGVGNYYIEAQTRDAKRTDVIVDYLGEQFIVELKIWHGNEYNERGEKQLLEYLEYYHADKGYMISFNFNKKKNVGMKTIEIGDKKLIEAVI